MVSSSSRTRRFSASAPADLGAPLGVYLAAAGVGRIGLVDFDVVDNSNLQRQILFGTKDVGRPKIAAAADRPARSESRDPDRLTRYETRLHQRKRPRTLFKDYDIIVDGTDNFPTRYLVNDACVLLGKPNVYGSIFRFEEARATIFAYPGAARAIAASIPSRPRRASCLRALAKAAFSACSSPESSARSRLPKR